MSAQAKPQSDDNQNQAQPFSADVARLLDIVAHALYTNHDVFLRELISNAADACDRLRYDAIQDPSLTKDNAEFRICAYTDTTNRTLTLVDNGIGMSKDELAENLGTIAKSGTAALMEQIKQSQGESDQLKLIGQFGVGFYAGYMVASTIEVVSRKAGSDEVWLWESDGKSGFTISEPNDAQKARLDGARGTAITLHIKDEACEFLLDDKIKATVEQYSDHINVPIYSGAPQAVSEDSEATALNSANALWMRSNSEVSEKEYQDFYNHISNSFDEPVLTSHWRAEGAIEFSALLYIPTLRPWDLFDPSRKNFVKLHVRRVFITDELDSLMYPWLRFMRGVIDSEDLPLNISRESLQYNPIIEKIKNAVARRILSDLDKLSRNDAPAFETFWGQFGAVIKEGLYDATTHRDGLLKVCRFHSTHDNGAKYTSLSEYVERMKDGQNEIYYVSGDNIESVKNSPQLEGFKDRGIEVLFMTDTVDDFWLQNVTDYKDYTFKSITKGDIDLESFGKDKEDQDSADQNEEAQDLEKQHVTDFITFAQGILKDKVHNVRSSKRLTSSAVCLVAPDNAVDMHMERVLKVNQKYDANTKPVLEVNPNHSLVQKLAQMHQDKSCDEALLSDAAYMLFDQAKIIQGDSVDNPTEFARRMSAVMEKAL